MGGGLFVQTSGFEPSNVLPITFEIACLTSKIPSGVRDSDKIPGSLSTTPQTRSGISLLGDGTDSHLSAKIKVS